MHGTETFDREIYKNRVLRCKKWQNIGEKHMRQTNRTNERKIKIEEKHTRRTYQRNKVDNHITKIYTRNIRTRKYSITIQKREKQCRKN